MAFIKLQFKPGLNRDQSNYSGEGGWWACDKIRFRSGYPEKIGGWVKSTPNTMAGACRQMNNWITTYSDNFLSAGTNEQVYIEAGGYFYNITPLRDINPSDGSPDTDNCVYTQNASTTVTITIATPHGMTTGDFVTISGVTGTGSAIGGIPVSQINGTHKVVVTTSTSFTFTVTTAATSTVSGQGGTAITLEYSLPSGYPIVTAGYGWGVGTWGRDAWGLGAATPIYFAQRDWWFDNFDNDLVMNYRDGQMYWWARGTNIDPANALATRAIRMQTYASNEGFDPNAVPSKIMQCLVSQQDKHLLAFGAVPFGSTNPDDFDPLLIRWADQDTPADWTPRPTNSAGFIRVSRGSRIVRALPTRQEILVFTDTHLYTLQFLGTTDVFGLQEYADNISIASPRAVATAANITYWMGRDKFYAYTGRVETLPCSLRNHVFQNINMAQYDQIICGTNEEWNEVWWFYPTAESEYNNAYVIYNHLEKIWYYGSIDRTAWLDTPLRDYPVAANSPQGYTESYLYNHEDGVDDDELPMVAYIQSNDFDLDDGEQFMLSRRLIPDVSFNGSTAAEPSLAFQIRPRNFPGTSYQEDPADEKNVVESSVDQYTAQVFIRARARQMAIKVISEDMGVQWQLGAPRLDARADGKR